MVFSNPWNTGICVTSLLGLIFTTFHLILNSWASLLAQLVKNLPAMWETWVLSPGWEDALEKGKATHSRISAWRIPRPGEFLYSPWSCKHEVSWTQLTFTFRFHFNSYFYYF